MSPHRKNISGVTLVELMVTIFILSIGVLAAIGSFQYISTSTQLSKSRTLATNLAQEKIEKLKNISYYMLSVATNVYTDSRVSPSIDYDNSFYTPENIVEGGIPFIRTTRVDYAYQNGSTISTASWTTDDTSLKQITVYVLWQEGSAWKYQQVQNLMTNPAANPLSATASGSVKTPGGVAIPGALVQVIDNSNWFSSVDGSGNYRFNVSPGSYTLQSSSNGYFTSTTNGYQNFTSGNTTTINFTLTQMATGTVTGQIFIDTNIVIGQVVASSVTDRDYDYLELYNSSTSTLTMGPMRLWIGYYDHNWNFRGGYITTNTNSLGPNRFFLVANTPDTIQIGGVIRNVDGYCSDSAYQYPNHFILPALAGGIYVYFYKPSTGWAVVDRMGWYNGATAPVSLTVETQGVAGTGLPAGHQYVRRTGTGVYDLTYGPAYDSDNNSIDFTENTTITVTPSNSSVSKNPESGRPSYGAMVNLNDPFNNSGGCTAATVGGCPVCAFSVSAATGAWTMEISSNGYYAQIQNINVQPSASTGVPNGGTTPSWASVGNANVTLLQNTTSYAFVSGYVITSGGSPLNGIKVIDGNGRSTTTGSNGAYTLLASSGVVYITANPNDSNMNHSYVTSPPQMETLQAGALYDGINFTLELGGILRAYFQTGTSRPLPGRIAVALKQGGADTAQASSDSTGYCYLQNLSTGVYTITPELDSLETASPGSLTVTMASTGTSTSVSTFTITSGIVTITGQVLVGVSSAPITTGTLILASSTSITSTLPPTQSGATGAACSPCYYTTSSDASANYTLQLRSSAIPYRLYGWYTTFSGSTPHISKSVEYQVTVSTPGVSSTQNISW
jgi:Tfp pilus assembly protein PilV